MKVKTRVKTLCYCSLFSAEVILDRNLLSPKEFEVLNLLAKGFLYKEIGDKLSISVNTVKQHIHKIYQKLHVGNRTEAINKIYRN